MEETVPSSEQGAAKRTLALIAQKPLLGFFRNFRRDIWLAKASVREFAAGKTFNRKDIP